MANLAPENTTDKKSRQEHKAPLIVRHLFLYVVFSGAIKYVLTIIHGKVFLQCEVTATVLRNSLDGKIGAWNHTLCIGYQKLCHGIVNMPRFRPIRRNLGCMCIFTCDGVT